MKSIWLSNSLEPTDLFGGIFVSGYLYNAFKKLGTEVDIGAWKDIYNRYDLLTPYEVVGSLDYAVNPTMWKRVSRVKKCYFWAIDDPEILHGPKNGWDILFTHSKGSVKLHEEIGRKEVHYLPLAFDPRTFFPIDNKKILDVVYVGNGIASKSYDIIMEPASNFDLNIWGKDWNKSTNHQFRRFLRGNIPPNKVNDVYSRTKIVLGMHRQSQRETQESFIMRDFEVLATKSFVISDTFKGCEYFKGGMIFSESAEETKELIEYYLDPDNIEERNKIAQKGYDIVTKNKDTYEERAKKIIEIVGL